MVLAAIIILMKVNPVVPLLLVILRPVDLENVLYRLLETIRQPQGVLVQVAPVIAALLVTALEELVLVDLPTPVARHVVPQGLVLPRRVIETEDVPETFSLMLNHAVQMFLYVIEEVAEMEIV